MNTINLSAGDDLQRALSEAQPGDEIVLPAGAIYTGNFITPVKSGSSLITVRSSRSSELPARVTPEQSPLLATLATPNVGPVLRAPVFSHHYRFEGIKFTQGPEVPFDSAAGFAWGYNLIELGEGSAGGAQTTFESIPHHFEFYRVMVQPRDSATMLQRGITLNCAETSITNSHISGIKWPGVETHAIGGWNGSGPFLIENNYLEAAGINILFGGAATLVPNLIASDIVIRRNTLTKLLEWQGKGFSVKNLFELKNARRVTFTDNDCRYSWPDAQTGWAVILNAFHDSPQNVIDDIEIACNTFQDIANGINLRGMDDGDTSSRMHRIRIHDNLLENIGAFNGEGKSFQVLNGAEAVEIDHNTVRGLVGSALLLDTFPVLKITNLKFTNNLMPHGTYGIFGNGGFFGTAALNQFALDWLTTGNALYAKPQDPAENLYPIGNFFPADEAAASTIIGTDGVPVGARTGITTPDPLPPPTPIPIPEPVPCLISAPASVSIPRNGTGEISITVSNLTQPTTVQVVGSDGQVTVSPLSKTVSPTSVIVAFKVKVKKQSRTITFQSPCGSVSVKVNVK